ncbi:hypothetical protein ACYPKM_02285 [Pseudomonas aeruginosa]
MNQKLTQEYLEAFARSNPNHAAPTFLFNKGWYRLDSPGIGVGRAFREDKLLDMIETLNRRAKANEEKAQKLVERVQHSRTCPLNADSGLDFDVVIQDLTGQPIVYPGHPLVLAYLVMRAFSSFSVANGKEPGSDYHRALTSSIPGAGDHMHAAVRALALGDSGNSIDDMVAFAYDYWNRGNAGGHTGNVSAGITQAVAIESAFRELAATWFAQSPAKE